VKLWRITLLLSLGAVLLTISSCKEKQLTKKEVLTSLNTVEAKLNWLDYRLARENWWFYTTGESDSLKFYEALYNKVVSDPTTIAALQNGKAMLTDEADVRRWELIHGVMVGAGIETQPLISSLRDSLLSIHINYRAEYDGEMRTDNYLYNAYRTNPDRTRRESAYRAWSSVGDEMAESLSRLFRLRNQAAQRSGYNSYFALSFDLDKFDLKAYLDVLKRLDSLSEGPYEKILEKIKVRLKIPNPEIWDLAYAYNGINQRIDSYFPVDSQMNFMQHGLEGVGFDLNKLPIYYDLDSRPGKSQFAYEFTIKAPYDMRVLANLTPGIYSERVLTHETGHALHMAFVSQPDDIFSNIVAGAWEEGMAQTVAATMDDKNWLTTYAHIPASVADDYLAAKRDQDIIYLRMTLVRLTFEFEAYQNANQDLNKLYWNLFERYMQLPRHDDIQPWAAIIHYTTHPVYLQNYLYADMIAAQTMHFLNKSYGSISGNPLVRAFLVQNYFRFGSRYNWRDLLKRGTDEKLNPDYLIQRLGIGSSGSDQ